MTDTQQAFFVATNGNDSWSERLAAPNADCTDGPFATLERVQDAMRATGIRAPMGAAAPMSWPHGHADLRRHGQERGGDDADRTVRQRDRGQPAGASGGEVLKDVAGIQLYGTSGTLISDNDIRNSPRYGISIKNWDGATVNIDTVVEYNRIYDTITETADGGAIEMLGRSNVGTRTTIRGNDIRNVGGLARPP